MKNHLAAKDPLIVGLGIGIGTVLGVSIFSTEYKYYKDKKEREEALAKHRYIQEHGDVWARLMSGGAVGEMMIPQAKRQSHMHLIEENPISSIFFAGMIMIFVSKFVKKKQSLKHEAK